MPDTPTPETPAELAAEAHRLVRRVSDASYTQGIDERHDSPLRDQRNDDKVVTLLAECRVTIDRLATLAASSTAPVAEVGDLIIEVRERVMRAGHKNRDKLYAAPAAAERKPDGWQPIETAPKDVVILIGPTKRMDICAAMHHSRDGWVTETPSEWVSIYTPTHWMPLPAAPAGSEGE